MNVLNKKKRNFLYCLYEIYIIKKNKNEKSKMDFL